MNTLVSGLLLAMLCVSMTFGTVDAEPLLLDMPDAMVAQVTLAGGDCVAAAAFE